MYDIIIIGAGTAGISAYKEAIKYTQNLLIINEGPWSTSCARINCMPSKSLISSANRLYEAKHLTEVAIQAELRADTSQVMQRVRELRDRFSNATIKETQSWPEEHRVNGRAEFVNANTVQVNGREYQSKSFIIAVGSRANVNQEWKDKLKAQFICSNELFELEQLPESIAVIGSGVVASELAQALSRLEVQTTIFTRSEHVGSITSPRLQQQVQQEFSKELSIYFKCLPTEVSLNNQQKVEIHFNYQDKPQVLEVDYMLYAAGRHSPLDNLKLETIDPAYLDTKNLPVDPKTMQLGKLPIFMAGDSYSDTPLQHEAANDGRKIIWNCLHPNEPKNVKTMTPLSIVFSSPEMAIAGASYKTLIQQKVDFVVGYASYQSQGRALIMAKNKGGIEVYIDRVTEKLLGAELFMAASEHLAQHLAWLISEEVTIKQLLAKPYYHPTLEEGLKTAFINAYQQFK